MNIPKNRNNPIFVCPQRKFDYSQGKPDERFQTILNVLKVCI